MQASSASFTKAFILLLSIIKHYILQNNIDITKYFNLVSTQTGGFLVRQFN